MGPSSDNATPEAVSTARAMILTSLEAAAEAAARLRANVAGFADLEAAAQAMANCLAEGGRIISFGNGGSMCDAMHFAEELSGRFRSDRRPLAAMAISDPAHLSCAANDYGWEQVFARYVEAHARQGDVVLAISTSGQSANVLAAAKRARISGATVVALTGRSGTALGDLADIEMVCSAATTDRIQEMHITLLHILVELIEFHLGFTR